MKKKMDRLLSGKFEYEQPRLLFSQKRISVALKAGETAKGELYLGTEDDRRIRGYVTSSSRRVVPGYDHFSGTTVRLPYGVDAVGLNPGETLEEWLCFTTNVGEYKVAVTVQTEKEEVVSSAGEVQTMEAFCGIAQTNFREAYQLFTSKSFARILEKASLEERSLYAGFSKQPVTYQHVEEFLVATGRKEPVHISLGTTETEFYRVKESSQEQFSIQRSGWGHLRLEIEVRGDFLDVNRRVVTDEDFIGSYYQVEYVIRRERLGNGCQYGRIIVRSPYEEVAYTVMASTGTETTVNLRSREAGYRIAMTRDYLEYRLGHMDFSTWAASCHYELNQLWEKGVDYPEYQVFEAYVLHLEGRDEEARGILSKFQDKSYSRDELEFAGCYLYVCMLTGLYKDHVQGLRKIQNFYMQQGDSLFLFLILLKLDPSMTSSASNAVFLMEEQFERGCRSPLLYLEAWEYICRDMTLLHRLSPFWVQVFLFAGKRKLLTEELSMRCAYLSGYEKEFHQGLYRALCYVCRAYPSQDSLEAICKYIMTGNPRKQEYFPWFSQAVEQGLRLTRLYEYYVETMDISYQRKLPKPLLMYFAYTGNTLGDSRKAYVYASVIANKEQDPQTYESYREQMAAFASAKIKEDKMNENYAVIYQEFLGAPETKGEAAEIAGQLFTNRVFCDDRKIRYVSVRHRQLVKEEIYTCCHGVTYPRLFTEDAAILFQDEKQRRYGITVPYNRLKLMDEREILPRILEKGVYEPGIVLHYCEKHEITEENLPVFQQLVESEAFTREYRSAIRKRIMEYYTTHTSGDYLDTYLKKLDYRAYAKVDRVALLEVLIERGLYQQAMGIMEEFGVEGLNIRSLLKITSRMITRCEGAEDEELLALASSVYRSGIYDEVILHYLMQYRFGPLTELISIWKSACGFEMDTYDMEERLLTLLMFTGDYRKEGEAILKSYVQQSGKERVIGAFLTQMSYGIFVKEYPMSAFVRGCLEKAYTQKWPVDKICHLALLKALSRERDAKGRYDHMKKALLEECHREGLAFAFFRKFPSAFLSPYQLDDKTYVEYHADPKARVILHYALDTGLGMGLEYKNEPLRNIYEGIFMKTFTLFYGESLHYYFQVEEDGKTRRTTERVLTMNQVEGQPVSKYQLLNQILSARRLDKEQEVLKGLKQYLRQEQYVREMFVMEKEAEHERNS